MHFSYPYLGYEKYPPVCSPTTQKGLAKFSEDPFREQVFQESPNISIVNFVFTCLEHKIVFLPTSAETSFEPPRTFEPTKMEFASNMLAPPYIKFRWHLPVLSLLCVGRKSTTIPVVSDSSWNTRRKWHPPVKASFLHDPCSVGVTATWSSPLWWAT